MAPNASLIRLFSRDDSANQNAPKITPTYVVGIILAGVLVLGCLVWLSIRACRKRARSKREDVRGAAFLSVRGLVKDEQISEKLPSSKFTGLQGGRSVVYPATEIPVPALQYSAPPDGGSQLTGPFAFALSASRSPSPMSHSRSSSWSSTKSSVFSVYQNSQGGRPDSSISYESEGQLRKVRILFNPVLPDELLLTKLGERLTVIQSFDDGWCVVGRQGPAFKSNTLPVFGQKLAGDDGIEIGVVPAWCFVKPIQGLKTERPVRSSSLGITVEMEIPGFSQREDVISWSNF